LRDYGIAGQIGLERTPDEYVATMVGVFREVWRVLRKDGTVWLNLGDSYGSGTIGRNDGGRHGDGFQGNPFHAEVAGYTRGRCEGLKPKDLCGIPWRVAFALQADGWYLRSDIIWAKPNPMPESVTDRPTRSHEYLFLLSKSERYYWDADAVRQPVTGNTHSRGPVFHKMNKTAEAGLGIRQNESWESATWGQVYERNIRSVWTIATEPTPEAHFATFPQALVTPCILAGSKQGDLVFDPFLGSGTVGVVAERLGRRWAGLELSDSYINIAEARTAQRGLFA
jgi:DNA modification methylase